MGYQVRRAGELDYGVVNDKAIHNNHTGLHINVTSVIKGFQQTLVKAHGVIKYKCKQCENKAIQTSNLTSHKPSQHE